MTHDEIIAVVQAHKEGKVIQSKLRRKELEWYDTAPSWDFHNFDYRVKPEPREWWVNKYHNWTCCNMHPTLDEAIKCSTGSPQEPIERIHVREVID